MLHIYLSTSCFHGDHDYCQAAVNAMGEPKRPAECKFCPAKCVCDCHEPKEQKCDE